MDLQPTLRRDTDPDRGPRGAKTGFRVSDSDGTYHHGAALTWTRASEDCPPR
jgi:hypothetical protein